MSEQVWRDQRVCETCGCARCICAPFRDLCQCGHDARAHGHVMTDGTWCSLDDCLCVEFVSASGTEQIEHAIEPPTGETPHE